MCVCICWQAKCDSTVIQLHADSSTHKCVHSFCRYRIQTCCNSWMLK